MRPWGGDRFSSASRAYRLQGSWGGRARRSEYVRCDDRRTVGMIRGSMPSARARHYLKRISAGALREQFRLCMWRR
jgi:hypothetical protein